MSNEPAAPRPDSQALAEPRRELVPCEATALTVIEDCRRAYQRDGNPLHVWAALRELLKPRTELGGPAPAEEYREPPRANPEPLPLPAWAADYLWGAARDLTDLASCRDPEERPPADSEALHDWLRTQGRRLADNDDAVAALGFGRGQGRSGFGQVHQAWREGAALDSYEATAVYGGGDPFEAARRTYGNVDDSVLRRALNNARARRGYATPGGVPE